MMLLSTIISLVFPILIGKVAIDVAIKNEDTTLLTYLAIWIGMLYLISYVGNFYRIKWVNILGQNVIYDLRQSLFSHVQRLSHRFFDSRSAGSIFVRILNDVYSLHVLFINRIFILL